MVAGTIGVHLQPPARPASVRPIQRLLILTQSLHARGKGADLCVGSHMIAVTEGTVAVDAAGWVQITASWRHDSTRHVSPRTLNAEHHDGCR
jgi:hypothetical protein